MSFEGFREILERKIELAKAERIAFNLEGFGTISNDIQISMLESAISNLDKYLDGTLQKEYLSQAEFVKNQLAKKDNKEEL